MNTITQRFPQQLTIRFGNQPSSNSSNLTLPRQVDAYEPRFGGAAIFGYLIKPGAYLPEANLAKSNLTEANLTEADLTGKG